MGFFVFFLIDLVYYLNTFLNLYSFHILLLILILIQDNFKGLNIISLSKYKSFTSPK